MRIGIDMLGNQSTSRARGIGRYVRGLVSCLVARHPQHDYFLYHHPGLPGRDDPWPARATVREIAPVPGDPTLRDTSSRLIMDNPDRLDVYLVPSALESYVGYLPPPKPLDGPKMAVVIYDLIPALFQEQYLTHRQPLWANKWAMRIVRQYDLLLTISESTRADCLRLLGVPPERVATIGTASDPGFFVPDRRRVCDAATTERLRELGVTAPFVFYVSADDERKNHKGLVAAFGLLSAELRETHQLVLTGRLPAEKERELHAMARRHGIADRLVLTNHVPDEVMRLLYQRCAAFAFVSRYEGFGLPLLEAMHCGAPVLAGRNSSQIEVVGEAGLLADIDDLKDLATKLQRLLVDRELAQALRERGPAQAARFRWETTADRAAAAIERLTPRGVAGAAGPTRRVKPRLAYFSPLPPQTSGIAEYSANLLQALGENYTIDLYHDSGCVPNLCHGSNSFPCRDYRTFARFHRAVPYRRILYQMGNSELHRFIYETLLRFPGIVVLHDLSLANVHASLPRQPGAPADHFLRELTANAAEYQASPDAWHDEPGGLSAACARRGIMCDRRLLDAALAIIVHDPWNEATIRRSHPDYLGRIHMVPHGVSVPKVAPDWHFVARQYAEVLEQVGLGAAAGCDAVTPKQTRSRDVSSRDDSKTEPPGKTLLRADGAMRETSPTSQQVESLTSRWIAIAFEWLARAARRLGDRAIRRRHDRVERALPAPTGPISRQAADAALPNELTPLPGGIGRELVRIAPHSAPDDQATGDQAVEAQAVEDPANTADILPFSRREAA